MLNVAHNTSTTLACWCKLPFYPAMYMNHSLLTAPVYNVFDLGAGDLQGLLTIDGNETRGTLQLNCTVGAESIYVILLTIEGLYMATNVTVEQQKSNNHMRPLSTSLCTIHGHSLAGPLPPPENVTISSQNSSVTQLQWKPPYCTMNRELNVIHVDPKITHYTVYIFDAFSSSPIDSVHVTEPGFTPPNSVPLCPIYKVSAWNAGGEGELSEPVQDSTPQGK